MRNAGLEEAQAGIKIAGKPQNPRLCHSICLHPALTSLYGPSRRDVYLLPDLWAINFSTSITLVVFSWTSAHQPTSQGSTEQSVNFQSHNTTLQTDFKTMTPFLLLTSISCPPLPSGWNSSPRSRLSGLFLIWALLGCKLQSHQTTLRMSLGVQQLRIHLPIKRAHGFNPWSGKIPHALGQLSPWTTTTETNTPRACAPQQEKPPWQEASAHN